MASNEELALLAQQGDKAALSALWEQNQGLLTKLFARYFPLCPKYRCEPEDLLQCGYFVIMRAARNYAPERGLKFTSYLHHHVQTATQETFCTRTSKKRPVEVSGHTPAGEDGDELLNLIVDPDAENQLEQAEERVWQEQLRKTLDAAIDKLPAAAGEVIRCYYWEGETHAAIARRRGCSPGRVNELAQQGRRRLAGFSSVRAWREDIIGRATRRVGLGVFRDSGQSAVEWAVERLESRELLEEPRIPPEE